MTTNRATKYSIKHGRGKAHIAGLDEVVTTGMDSLNYAKTACPALSRNIMWSTAQRTDDLQQALEALRSGHYGTGPCVKCEKTALAQIAAALNCPNPWHASAPSRMKAPCAECKTCPNPWHQETPGRDRMWCCPSCPQG